jgi:tetratricopeptide (TPR) repeat protein
MNSPENPTLQTLHKFLRSPIGRFVLPLALLLIYCVARFSGYEIFGKHGPSRPTLTQAEAQQLESKSEALIGKQKFEEALEPTLKLYQAYPENYIYIGRLADMLDHLGRYTDEAQMWEKYLDRAPTPVQACPQYGRAYWKQGDGHEKQAIAAFERCVSFDPKNTDLIFYLAHALEMSGAWDRAAQQYEQGLTISPRYIDLELGLARCRVRQDRPDEARQIAQKVLAKSPATADALLILGMVYLQQDRYRDARKVLERGAKLAPNDTDFKQLLARVAAQQNDRGDQHNVKQKPKDGEIRAKRDSIAAKE